MINMRFNHVLLLSTVYAKKYIPPALRNEEENSRCVQRLRGLLNRLVESNIAAVVKEVSRMYEEEGRSLVTNTVVTEIIQVNVAFRSPYEH